MRRALFVIFIFLLLPTAISSNSNFVLEQGDEDVELMYGMPYDFLEYSAYTANSYASAQWQSAIYTGLYKRSSSAQLDWVPDMAASMPQISDNKRIFTIDLRSDIVFSDGSPFDANDVIFSYQVAMTPAINTNFYDIFPGFMTNESILEKVGDFQIEANLNQYFEFPFSFLSTPIIPEEIYRDRYNSCLAGVLQDCIWNNPDLSDAISAGPYKAFDYDDTNQAITLVKNDLYYDWSSSLGNVDTIIFKQTKGKLAAIAELAAGDIDILDSQYMPGIDELSLLPGVSEAFVGTPAHREISLNHVHPHFGTGEAIPNNEEASEAERLAEALLVRRAMSHITDRDYAVNEISNGLAIPASTTMPSASIGWDPSITPREYDVDLAKMLMEAAGYNYDVLTDSDYDGTYETFFFSIDVMSPNTGPLRKEFSTQWVLDVQKIGIGVNEHHSVGWDIIIPRTFGYPVATASGVLDADGNDGLVPLWDDGGYDVLLVGYGWALDWNPQGLYDSSGSHATAGGGNFYNFDLNRSSDQKTNVEPLVNAYLVTLDFNERISIVKSLQQELYDKIPVIPLVYPQSHWGFRNTVSNLDVSFFQ